MRNLVVGFLMGAMVTLLANAEFRRDRKLPPLDMTPATPVAFHQDPIPPDPAKFVAEPPPPPRVVPPPAPVVAAPPPPPPRPKLYGCVDQWGVQWTHTDPAYLQQFVMARNASAVAQTPLQPARRGLFSRRDMVYACPNGQCTP